MVGTVSSHSVHFAAVAVAAAVTSGVVVLNFGLVGGQRFRGTSNGRNLGNPFVEISAGRSSVHHVLVLVGVVGVVVGVIVIMFRIFALLLCFIGIERRSSSGQVGSCPRSRRRFLDNFHFLSSLFVGHAPPFGWISSNRSFTRQIFI